MIERVTLGQLRVFVAADGLARPMAGARTRGAGADVKNHPPLLTGFRASGWSHAPGPLRPLSTKHRGSVAHNWPTLITWALAFANSNSGNEIVRPETLGPARRELSPKRAKPTAETVFRAQATEISRYF